MSPASPGSPDLAALGAALRTAGLTPRALAAWAGTGRLSALPHRLPALATREPVPAAAALALFVAGAEVAIDRARMPIEELAAAGLVERDGARIRATVAILPLARGLLVCDRVDAPDAPELVCWPDDSSLHLATALPSGRRASWIDLGTGSGFAPLARPELASAITALDVNPRAVAFARLGAALSGVRHVAIEEADVAQLAETAEVGDTGARRAPAALVTCNAPMPGEHGAAVWRRAGDTFFARLWEVARAFAAPGGEIVIHAERSAIPEDLPGERLLRIYTPEGARAFGVLWWRPDAPARQVVGYRELTVERPHVDTRDHDALAQATSC